MKFNNDGSIELLINGKRIREHRVVYEQYYNCCLLPSTAIHHKNGINSDNRIENLEPYSRKSRSDNFGGYTPIPSDRFCMKCSSTKTSIEKGHHHWHKRPGGYICKSCDNKERTSKRKSRRPHRIAFEQHYKCRLLRWAEVRPKNGIKTDIRIENLEVVGRGGSASISRMGFPRIPLHRRCLSCKRFYDKGYWYRRPEANGYICNV